MNKNYFEVVRGGVHTTFQDNGYLNVQHLGITTGGVVDNCLFQLANKLVNNDHSLPVVEFANQGPQLKLKKGKCRIAITGNVAFNIIYEHGITPGEPNRSYALNEGDTLDILHTIKSNYGYLSVEGGFALDEYYSCCSTLVQSNLGPNDGRKISHGQSIYFIRNGSELTSCVDMDPSFSLDNTIRVVRGPQMNYFMLKVIKDFFSKPFTISNMTSRMGVRIEGNTIHSIISHNIASEGIVKGSIQVPGNGDPIILMTDHPTIGGYPKIATVILADIPKIAQFPPGTTFFFEEVSIEEAEEIFKDNSKMVNSLLNRIEKK